MSKASSRQILSAKDHFREARLRANLEQIRDTLTGKSTDLLSYEDVRQKIRAPETAQRENTTAAIASATLFLFTSSFVGSVPNTTLLNNDQGSQSSSSG